VNFVELDLPDPQDECTSISVIDDVNEGQKREEGSDLGLR